jgi:hypothetical protein
MHTAYTPVYYLAVGELTRFLGDHGYTVGRAVSLLATLVGTAALACSVKRLSCRWWVAMLGAGLFLTQNLTMLLWAPMHRVDPLALGFTLVGLALATRGRASAAAILFVLALATKQTYVVGPIAVACALWPCRARLVRFAAIVGGGSVVGIGLGQWLTGGWFLWHTVTANGNELDLSTFATLMGSFLQFNGLPVLAALGSMLLPARPGERLWRVYFVGCLLTLPTIAKVGAVQLLARADRGHLSLARPGQPSPGRLACQPPGGADRDGRLVADPTPGVPGHGRRGGPEPRRGSATVRVAIRVPRGRPWRRAVPGRDWVRRRDRPRAWRRAHRQLRAGRRRRQAHRLRVPDLPVVEGRRLLV